MKKLVPFLLIILFLFFSCSKNEENLTIALNFTQNWNGISVTNQDFNTMKFTNENNDKISIERLRYLISNISLISGENHFLFDVDESLGNLITISDVYPGNYKLKFTFGLSDAENTDGIYQDLNSVNFNVPEMLGGGYHFMQLDGKYKDATGQDANFNYHTIRAVDKTDPTNLKFEDTSFTVNLGNIEIKENATIEIKMNIAEWFKNPNTWNLNALNTVLMPNFEAQKLMSANGKTVFSLGEMSP